ncbi:methyltransferase [Actinomycetaceae bacterium WB03_NA08]|uniref:Methyltransferase n=1 Tax=Scrofimicrobium canadense TaxID=2652290 RepID=A0A6N7VPG1_9ACTO|nr:methyltransferase [Scrofimicrobium canadense]MSS83597.1 methyltransferase [Scrofimicrobium canadense]
MTHHYFSQSPIAGADERHLVTFSTRGHDFQVWVAGQVFSAGRLDPGTAELLRAVPSLPSTGTFLDLGCGWGPVAITAGAESPQAEVWAVDVNPRAVALTADNAKVNSVDNVRAMDASEAYQEAQARGTQFDVILSNPPVRVGKTAMQTMVKQWLDLLSPTGVAWLVMSKNLGADSFITWLGNQGFQARKHSSRKGFRIIEVRCL